MFTRLRQIFGQQAAPLPAIPAGQRAYAIGDIHGRDDLFAALAAGIEADDAARGAAETTIILLGDLIDRGPDSAGVVARARAWQAARSVRVLIGNHEEMLLDSMDDPAVLRQFLRHGGRETILSYLDDPAIWHRADMDAAQGLLRAAIPAADLAFLRGGENMIAIGDYLFVHAGIHPDRTLAAQEISDLRWIREPFLSHPASYGPTVVHGHSISGAAVLRHNRIGIDTGAFASGLLTAVGLQDTGCWLIEARESKGAISIVQRSVR